MCVSVYLASELSNSLSNLMGLVAGLVLRGVPLFCEMHSTLGITGQKTVIQ